MISVEDFRERVRAGDFDDLVDEVILAEGAAHVSGDNVDRIISKLSVTFRVPAEKIYLRIVGSAKLGFSIVEKRSKDGNVLARYRRFSWSSDIDVLVICPEIFDQLWLDLCRYAHRAVWLPWDSGRLGDYLVCGWLRPDHFPKSSDLLHCADWWDVFRALSADSRFGRRKVRGGLFQSMDHARKYITRGLLACAQAEGLET